MGIWLVHFKDYPAAPKSWSSQSSGHWMLLEMDEKVTNSRMMVTLCHTSIHVVRLLLTQWLMYHQSIGNSVQTLIKSSPRVFVRSMPHARNFARPPYSKITSEGLVVICSLLILPGKVLIPSTFYWTDQNNPKHINERAQIPWKCRGLPAKSSMIPFHRHD